MNRTRGIVGAYFEKYLDKLLSREIGKRTLARIIISENPNDFTEDDVELIRGIIREITGTKGSHGRKVVAEINNDGYRDQLSAIPASVAKTQKIHQLPDGKYLILSDCHFPYHNKEAVETAVQEGIKQGVTGIYLNGDTMDMFQISEWTKLEKAPDIGEEVKVCRKFLDYLREKFPTAPIWFKIGNHENRLERYIWKNAPQLAPMISETLGESLGLAQLLGLDKYGIEYVSDRSYANAGGLGILHGHEFGHSIFSPVNPARGAFLRAKSSILIGHHHQTSEHHEGNLKGENIACYSTGCLCDLSPNYRPFAYTKWNHGAATVEVFKDSFRVDNFRIENNQRL